MIIVKRDNEYASFFYVCPFVTLFATRKRANKLSQRHRRLR